MVPPSAIVANNVASKIKEVWKRASLPTLSRKRIVKIILTYNGKYQNVIKPIKEKYHHF